MSTSTPLLIMLAALSAGDVEAAKRDRNSIPRDSWPAWAAESSHAPHVYYVAVGHGGGEVRDDLIASVGLAVRSTSRAPLVDGTLTAVPGAPGLLRLNIDALGWEYSVWREVIAANPYGSAFPLIVRGDWLVYELADSSRSDAYYRLLFGTVPKTRDEFLRALGVNEAARFRFGMIEGASRVAVQGVRWIENRPAARGWAWGTRDVLRVVDASDPLERPDGDFRHDGEEWIIGVRKLSARTGQAGGLNIYALFDGRGNLVRRAPIELVEDKTRFAGLSAITAPGSCFQCHSLGINQPTENAYRDLLERGVAIDAQSFADLAAFHLADLSIEIEHDRAAFARGVALATTIYGPGPDGRDVVVQGPSEPEAAAAAFKRTVDRYLAPVDLETAAAELGVTPERLRATIEAEADRASPGARTLSLARGGKIRRETFAELFRTLQLYLGQLDTAAGGGGRPSSVARVRERPNERPKTAARKSQASPSRVSSVSRRQNTRGRDNAARRRLVPQRP